MDNSNSWKGDFFDLMNIRAQTGLATSPEDFKSLADSARSNKFFVLQGHRGGELGYVIWAGINKESARRFQLKGTLPEYSHEWNEGNICLITDVVIFQHVTKSAKKILLTFLRKQRCIMFTRKGRVKTYFRRGSRFVQVYSKIKK